MATIRDKMGHLEIWRAAPSALRLELGARPQRIEFSISRVVSRCSGEFPRAGRSHSHKSTDGRDQMRTS